MLGNIGKEIGKEVAEGLAKKAAPKVVPAAKKPLEWGFKGRKKTDIEDLDYESLIEETYRGPASALDDIEKQSIRDVQKQLTRNMKKLERGAKKNKYIANEIDSVGEQALDYVNEWLRIFEDIGVPRELTGKMLGSRFNRVDYGGLTNKITEDTIDTWKKNWLSYYNDLTPAQKETFDALQSGWEGTMSDLLEAVKRLA